MHLFPNTFIPHSVYPPIRLCPQSVDLPICLSSKPFIPLSVYSLIRASPYLFVSGLTRFSPLGASVSLWEPPGSFWEHPWSFWELVGAPGSLWESLGASGRHYTGYKCITLAIDAARLSPDAFIP